MKLLVYLSKLLVCDVRIYLRRLDIGVTEHYLDAADICAVFKQVCREAVAQDMRSHFAGDAGFDRVLLDHALDRTGSQALVIPVFRL